MLKKRMVIIGVIILFFVLIYTLIPVHASVTHTTNNYRWNEHNTGISGAQIKDLISDPNHSNTLYLVGSQGVYKTTDNGNTWVEKNTGLPNSKNGIDLLLDASSNILYAVMYDAAGDQSFVYKTVDGGDNWAFASNGTSVAGYDGTGSKSYITGVTIKPGNPQTLYAGTIIGGWHGGIFKSINSGTTWTQIAGSNIAGSGIGNDAWPLVMDTNNPSTLWAGTAYDGVFKSVDEGVHWSYGNGTSGQIFALAIDPGNSNRLFAGGAQGLYRSLDGGAHWTLSDQISGIVKAISLDPVNPQIVYVGVEGKGLWKSENYGTSFTNLGSTTITINKIAVDPANPQNLFLATQSNGIYYSSDGGQTLTAKNNGLPITVEARIIKSDSLGNLYAAVWGKGFYGSQNQGKDWEILSQATDILDFELASHDPEIIYTSGTNVKKSSDGGSTWQTVFTPSSDYLWALAIDPNNIQVLFTAGNGGKMYKSADGGLTWNQKVSFAPGGRVMDIQVDQNNSNRVYAATYGYFWKSEDGGETWIQKTTGLSGSYANRGRYLAIDPTEPNIIYYDTQYGGIFRSSDYGENWSKLNLTVGGASPVLNNILIDSTDHSKLYVADYMAKQVYYSLDKGENWSIFTTTGLPEILDALYWVWQDESDPTRFYAGFFYGGIYAFENYVVDFDTTSLSASDVNGSVLERGDEVVYTFNLRNIGWMDAHEVAFVNNYSPFLEFIPGSVLLNGDTILNSTDNGSSLSFSLDQVGAKTNQPLTLHFRVKQDATDGGIVNSGISITQADDPGTAIYASPLIITIVDNQPPTGSVVINTGDFYATTAANNILTLQATDNYSSSTQLLMMCANTDDFQSAVWEPFYGTKNWNFPSGDGTKSIYVKFKDAKENTSPVYSDSIMLDSYAELSAISIDGHPMVDSSLIETQNRRPVFSGLSESGATITVKISMVSGEGSTVIENGTRWSWMLAEELSTGSHAVEINARDPAGNRSAVTYTMVINAVNNQNDDGNGIQNTNNQLNNIINIINQLPNTGKALAGLIFAVSALIFGLGKILLKKYK